MIILYGPPNVGKSTCLFNLIGLKHQDCPSALVECVPVSIPNKGKTKIWDLSGQSIYARERPSFFKLAASAIIFCRDKAEAEHYEEQILGVNPNVKIKRLIMNIGETIDQRSDRLLEIIESLM